MRKIRDVLWLHLKGRLSQRQIAAALGISYGVVAKYISLAMQLGLGCITFLLLTPLQKGGDYPLQCVWRFRENAFFSETTVLYKIPIGKSALSEQFKKLPDEALLFIGFEVVLSLQGSA